MPKAPAKPDHDGDTNNQQLHSDLIESHGVFPILNLPKELRLRIYEYLATEMYKPIDCLTPKRFGYWPVMMGPTNFLTSSRTIYDEVMAVMHFINDRQPVAVLCQPVQQQKYCALLATFRKGYELDHGAFQNLNSPVSSTAVNAALDVLLEKIPYGERQNNESFPLRLLHLRHFLSQNIKRLRRDPRIHLTLLVGKRPSRIPYAPSDPNYSYFYNVRRRRIDERWCLQDEIEVQWLLANLRNGIKKGNRSVTTKVTVRGVKEDEVVKRAERMCRLWDVGKWAGEVEFSVTEKEVWEKMCAGRR